MEMFTNNMTQTDPAIWLLQYVSWEVATKVNNFWIGVEVCPSQKSSEIADVFSKSETWVGQNFYQS